MRVTVVAFWVLMSVVAPLRRMREELKSTNKVLEVYVHTSQIRGREANFSKIYQPPVSDFVDIDTTHITPDEAADRILRHIDLHEFA